jgi:hypothetical protein
LELCHFISGIDVVDPFTFILIALMKRVAADIAGLLIGKRFAANANGSFCWLFFS